MYDNGTTTWRVKLDKHGEKTIPKNIIIIKTWAGEITVPSQWYCIR